MPIGNCGSWRSSRGGTLESVALRG
jgi:hypothetical protein